MTLELELLVNAWDNYKKNVISERSELLDSLMTPIELNLDEAVNMLLDAEESIQKSI